VKTVLARRDRSEEKRSKPDNIYSSFATETSKNELKSKKKVNFAGNYNTVKEL
jgi:hypothetical protein